MRERIIVIAGKVHRWIYKNDNKGHTALRTFGSLIEFKNILEPASGHIECVGGCGSFSPNSRLIEELPKCFRHGNMSVIRVLPREDFPTLNT